MPVIALYARLRSLAGVKEAAVNSHTLLEALQALVQRYPALAESVLAGDDPAQAGLRPHVVVTINGVHVDPAGSLAIPVDPEDKIAIFPPIAGGS